MEEREQRTEGNGPQIQLGAPKITNKAWLWQIQG